MSPVYLEPGTNSTQIVAEGIHECETYLISFIHSFKNYFESLLRIRRCSRQAMGVGVGLVHRGKADFLLSMTGATGDTGQE